MIILDTRETKLIELFKQHSLTTATIPMIVENLAIGDIILRFETLETTNKFEIIIERKSISDMCASIKDGRYKEQKIRLLAERQQRPANIKIVYLIEGNPAELHLSSDKTMLNGSIISSIFRDEIPIIRTYSLQETLDIIIRLHERLLKDYREFFPSITSNTASNTLLSTVSNSSSNTFDSNNTYLCAIKKNKKDNMTPAVWNMNCLCGIPGVSSAIAIKIAEQYPTIRSLLEAYQACIDSDTRECLLAEIILTETDKQRRRIGNVISKRVYEYLHR